MPPKAQRKKPTPKAQGMTESKAQGKKPPPPKAQGMTKPVKTSFTDKVKSALDGLNSDQGVLLYHAVYDVPPPSGQGKELTDWKDKGTKNSEMTLEDVNKIIKVAKEIRDKLPKASDTIKDELRTIIVSEYGKLPPGPIALSALSGEQEVGSAPTKEQEALELAQLVGTVLEDRSLGVVGQGGSSAGTFFSTDQPSAAPFSSLQYAEPPTPLSTTFLNPPPLFGDFESISGMTGFGNDLESAFSAEPTQLKRVGKYAGAGSGGESITLPQAHYVQQQAVNKIDQAFQRLLTPSGQIEFIDYRNPITVRTGESKVLRDIDNPPVRSEFLDKALASYPIDPELALPENFFKLNNSYTNTAKLETRAPWQKPGFVYEPAVGANWFGKANGPYKDSQWTQGNNPVQMIDLNVQPGGIKDYFPFNFSIG